MIMIIFRLSIKILKNSLVLVFEKSDKL